MWALCVAFMAAAVGCGGPRIVPDRELALIFHDIFLVNTYAEQARLDMDSLNIYEPVFEAHGYTIEDIQYTIGNFAKRKSSRLSDDVVSVASEMLNRESNGLRDRSLARDTVIMLARQRTARQLRFVPRIEVRRVADTARLRMVVDSLRPGDYEVSYSYLVDSLDRNDPLRVDVWLADSAGRRSGNYPRTLERRTRRSVVATLPASGQHLRLVVDLNGYGKGMSTPHMSVDSLTVRLILPAEEATSVLARRSWGGDDSILNASPYNLFRGIPMHGYEKDLRAPFVDPRGAGSR